MTDHEQFVLSFAEIGAADLPRVGGKGANLGELAGAGFPVPLGFCVTTMAFDAFITSSEDAATLYTALDTVTAADLETARAVGEEVRRTLLAASMPPAVAHAVRQAWQQVGTSNAYAVRSSATAEDLPDASFAGQQDTYLNIRGEAELLDAVHRCWVSLFTDRAILYRCQNGFSHRAVQLSVVVQQMVMAETSGILFTADPLTGHRHSIAIDASFGLGEALVSGLVSPDAYRVDKRNHTISERRIADKLVAIFADKEGGTRQEALREPQRSQPVLTDAQILDLAALGSRVEAHYGAPQDIEWAIVADQIYLLQARPITALYPIDGLQSPDDSLHIYFSMGHQQMMTNAMSPLSLSSMKCLIPVGRRPGAIESEAVNVSGGRLFVDLTQPLRHPIARRVIFAVLSQFDALAPAALQIAMQRSDFQRPHGLALSVSGLRGLLHMVSRILSALWLQDLTGSAAAVDTLIAQQIKEMNAELNNTQTGAAQLRAAIQRMHGFFPIVFTWAPKFIAGEIARRLLARLAHSWADPADLEAYSLGLPGNVVTEMNLAVGDLADSVRRSPKVRAHFNRLGNDSQGWLAQAAQIEDSGPFIKAWEAFMAHYGARGPSEIDIKSPRWYEEPYPLLKVIAGHLQQEAGSHRTQHRKLVQAREAAVARLLTRARQGPMGWLRWRLVCRLIHAVHHGTVLREHHKFMVVQFIRIVKDVLKQIAIDLTDSGKLSQANDIWFLSWPELLALYEGEGGVPTGLIPQRQADLIRFQKLTPPMILTSDGETPSIMKVPGTETVLTPKRLEFVS